MLTGPLPPTLYKGAGPGTYWHLNNPKLNGGFTAGLVPATPNAILRHITRYSAPSPYLSFTTSFAVAREYALSGPAGVATVATPGYVYELDLSSLLVAPTLIDPVIAIAAASNGLFSHRHDGAQNLILEVSQGYMSNGRLSLAPQAGGQSTLPAVSQDLNALIFAIRDAEILVAGNVLSGALVNVHSVF
jgi:hypothetical protein